MKEKEALRIASKIAFNEQQQEKDDLEVLIQRIYFDFKWDLLTLIELEQYTQNPNELRDTFEKLARSYMEEQNEHSRNDTKVR